MSNVMICDQCGTPYWLGDGHVCLPKPAAPKQIHEVSDIVFIPCPICGSEVSLEQSFDVNVESTTAWIMCSGCDMKYGPLYPDTKRDVIEWAQEYNKQRITGLLNWVNAEIKKAPGTVGPFPRLRALTEVRKMIQRLFNQ